MSDSLKEEKSASPDPKTQIKAYTPSTVAQIATRRELIWSMSRRGLRTEQIMRVLDAQGLLRGLNDPYQTVRRDIRIGEKVARALRMHGNVVRAEAIYIGRLEELWATAMRDEEYGTARLALHDWAMAHGIKVEEPLSVVINQQQNVQVNVHGSGNGRDGSEALRTELKAIGYEVARLVGSRGVDKDPVSEDEPN